MLRKSILAILLSLSLIFFVVGCSTTTSEKADTTNAEVETEDKTDADELDDSLVGTWTVEGVVEEGETTIDMTFDKDGTFEVHEVLSAGQEGEGVDEQEETTSTGKGTYTVSGDELDLTYDSISSEGVTYDGQKIKDDLDGQTVKYTYKISDDKLELKEDGGDTETLTKKSDN